MARGHSLSEFQTAFPDAAHCVALLFKCRWPSGFVCPACGKARGAA
ncbi:MAG: transposase, partial [Rhodopila sp.]